MLRTENMPYDSPQSPRAVNPASRLVDVDIITFITDKGGERRNLLVVWTPAGNSDIAESADSHLHMGNLAHPFSLTLGENNGVYTEYTTLRTRNKHIPPCLIGRFSRHLPCPARHCRKIMLRLTGQVLFCIVSACPGLGFVLPEHLRRSPPPSHIYLESQETQVIPHNSTDTCPSCPPKSSQHRPILERRIPSSMSVTSRRTRPTLGPMRWKQRMLSTI